MGTVADYLKTMIEKHIESSHLVVWFDPERHYESFVKNLSIVDTTVFCDTGSLFELRRRVDPLVYGENLPRCIVYVPRADEKTEHALVAYTVLGAVLKPGQNPWQRNTRLSLIARNALKIPLGDQAAAAIEKQVESGNLSLAELDKMSDMKETLSQGVLSVIFGKSAPAELACAFLDRNAYDEKIIEKSALSDLQKLLEKQYGLSCPSPEDPPALRLNLARHVLFTAFSESLSGELPGVLRSLKTAHEAQHREKCHALVRTWQNRADCRKSYTLWAQRVGDELALSTGIFAITQLASCETFSIIDKILQELLEDTLPGNPAEELLELAKRREEGFWASGDPELKARWNMIVLAGEIIKKSADIREALTTATHPAAALAGLYTEGDTSWSLMDTYYRHLERRIGCFEGTERYEKLEALIASARQRYMETGSVLAESFVNSSSSAGYKLKGVLPQLEIFKKMVKPVFPEKKTAYNLVDALRYEMGRELAGSLTDHFDVTIQPACASFPTITEIGMASLVHMGEEKPELVTTSPGRIGLEEGKKILKDRPSRMKYLKETLGVPVYECHLDELLKLSKLKKTSPHEIDQAKLVVVTTTEIDTLCESNHITLAKSIMDQVFVQLRKAFHILRGRGITHFVITADHGYLFGEELECDMKIEPPGGDTADLHRRVWVGRGGNSHPSYLRTCASDVGFSGELELATPYGFGIFKASGGSEAYFHGGLSLQELIIPVITLSVKEGLDEAGASNMTWYLVPGSKKISSRFLSVQIKGTSQALLPSAPPRVRVEVHEREKVLTTAIAASYGFIEGTGEVQLKYSETSTREIEPDTVTLMLSQEPTSKKVDILLLDGTSGQELMKFKDMEVSLAL